MRDKPLILIGIAEKGVQKATSFYRMLDSPSFFDHCCAPIPCLDRVWPVRTVLLMASISSVVTDVTSRVDDRLVTLYCRAVIRLRWFLGFQG